MEKTPFHNKLPRRPLLGRLPVLLGLSLLILVFFVFGHSSGGGLCQAFKHLSPHSIGQEPRFERLPRKDDPFKFIPCTNATVLPRLEDPNPDSTWAALYDPNPDNYRWSTSTPTGRNAIYLCGYLDVPFDYKNSSEERFFRLAVTKYQVSGLACADGRCSPTDGQKSERTIVTEPGGPGGSGSSFVFRMGQNITEKYSDGRYDVLGWDPRGVNLTQPVISCFPHASDRDRWNMLLNQFPEATASPRQHLEMVDAMNEAVFTSCKETTGDLPRFVSTALVVRDMEKIRQSLGEEELTGYVVSYGTTIGQIYANMFPDKVGRLVLDGVCYARGDRDVMGFAKSALGNITDAWRDGFIGECVDAGPENCELAKPIDDKNTTAKGLETRMDTLLQKLKDRPVPAFTESSGPSLIRYSEITAMIYSSLYNARTWPALAQMLADLEKGNTTLASEMVQGTWNFNPAKPTEASPADWAELINMVICSDSYDSPRAANGMDWWEAQWKEMYDEDRIGGSLNYFSTFTCRHFRKNWPTVAEAYRGNFNNTLKNQLLLVSETYDPATPLWNARILHAAMGDNAKLVVHHGYGHSSRDKSDCTDSIIRNVILNGVYPTEAESNCYANEKPYRYGDAKDPKVAWIESLDSMGGKIVV